MLMSGSPGSQSAQASGEWAQKARLGKMDGEKLSYSHHLSSWTPGPTLLWTPTTPRSGPGSSYGVPSWRGVSSFHGTPELNTEHRGLQLRDSGLWGPTGGTPRSGPD